jgi:hypothetical protein
MTRFFPVTLAAGLSFLAVAAGPALAQQTGFPYARPNYGPYFRPQLSPYLDITRGGNAAVNYFLGTLPEFDRRINQQNVNTSLRVLDREVNAPPTQESDILNPLPGTGHPTGFQQLGSYFGPTSLRQPGSTTPYSPPRRR